MFKLWKLVSLFALIATHPTKTQALTTDQYEQDQPSLGIAPQTLNGDTLSPSPYVEDAFSPETQGLYDEEAMAPEYQYPSPAYAPEINEDEYPYVDSPSNIFPPSPSPATYIDVQALAPELEDIGDEFIYSPSEPPSPTSSPAEFNSGVVSDNDIAPRVEGADAHAHAPALALAFNYSAQDDSGYFSDDYDGQDYPEDQKKNGSAIGYFVVGAICVIGLGGFAYKKRRDEKRKPYQLYELARKGEI